MSEAKADVAEFLKLGTQEFWERLEGDPARLAAEVCLVDTANLDRTLETHAAKHAWVIAQHEMAIIELEKLEYEETKERALSLLRSKAVKDPDEKKGKTVDIMKAEVEGDTRVQTAANNVLLQREKVAALKAMERGLADRTNMLIQIASKVRAEMRDYHA